VGCVDQEADQGMRVVRPRDFGEFQCEGYLQPERLLVVDRSHLMAIELMLLAVNINFVAFSYYVGNMHGQVFVFFILTVAAAESAIGLAILVALFRNLRSIHVEDIGTLKG
jgi:NADH:ubiquinone oxidoreductase subunit K